MEVAIGYSGNPLIVSTNAIAYRFLSYCSADIIGSIKTINSHHFLWMVNCFSKREMHENGQDL